MTSDPKRKRFTVIYSLGVYEGLRPIRGPGIRAQGQGLGWLGNQGDLDLFPSSKGTLKPLREREGLPLNHRRT